MRIAFVLLPSATLPDPRAVAAAFRRIAPDEPPLLADVPAEAQSVLTFHLHGVNVHVALMASPVPGEEADLAARYSLSSFGTGWELLPHAAHLVVASTGVPESEPDERIDALVRHTRVVAAVAEAAAAVGVYWGDGHVTHDPTFFRDIAAEPEMLPMMLWNGVSLAFEGSRVSLLSLGMGQLELPDLLLTAPRAQANDALATLFDLLTYTVSLGQPIPDGDTIGRSADEKLRVRYLPSPADPDVPVWSVNLPD